MFEQSKSIVASMWERQETRRGLIYGGAEAIALWGIASAVYLKTRKSQEDTARIGIDISYPQGDSGQELPKNPDFIIVGVNGGAANIPNPYLAAQLSEAVETLQNRQIDEQSPSIQLYVNTANPGERIDEIDTWPSDNIDLNGNKTNNPHGECDGTNSLACSWQYGWNRITDITANMFSPVAAEVGISADPAGYTWWLDVETGNTWQSGSSDALERNLASLEGMTACFKELGCTVGLYSTRYQLGEIVGEMIPVTSNLNGLDSWLAGATESTAKDSCDDQPLTSGGKVVLVQFIKNDLDHNYECS